ncbi:MAG TPA: hypothetical protein VN578_07185 [Candidatus Binatia bacterium]|nr:hypothetical protein [Candidatus Binatia bacterium]
MDSLLTNLSAQELRRAASLKEKIEALQGELNRRLGGGAAPAGRRRGPGRRKMSRAAIAKIRAAQKARWAKIKGKASGAKAGRKPRRKVSAAGRARLSAIARARWKKARAAGRTTL